jgi:hypothetical protein
VEKVLYARTEISLFLFATGLKNAGVLEGIFSVSDALGTRIRVSPSIISDISDSNG